MDVHVGGRGGTTPLLVSVSAGLSGYPVIQLHGELDFSNRDEVRAHVARELEHGAAVVIMDLRWLTFIDSSGLHVVLMSDRMARRHGARLVLIPGPPQVHRMFEWVGLTERLTFAQRADSPDELGLEPSV